jgi:hypothetical protein
MRRLVPAPSPGIGACLNRHLPAVPRPQSIGFGTLGQEAQLGNRATTHRTADLTGYFAARLLDGYGLRGRKHLATSQGSTATDHPALCEGPTR